MTEVNQSWKPSGASAPVNHSSSSTVKSDNKAGGEVSPSKYFEKGPRHVDREAV